MLGAYGSLPMRLGGGPEELRVIHEDLLESYGSAFDKSRGGYLWDLCYADARALWAAWQCNARLLAQCNPTTATWSLSSWERTNGLSSYGLTIGQRRKQLAEHERRQGQSTSFQHVVDLLRETMGDTFVEIRLLDPDDANVHVPDNTYPWGTVDNSAPWYSSVSHVAVVLQDVPGVSEGEFYERVGAMNSILQGRLSVWATYDWIKLPAGFFLDVSEMDVVPFD